MTAPINPFIKCLHQDIRLSSLLLIVTNHHQVCSLHHCVRSQPWQHLLHQQDVPLQQCQGQGLRSYLEHGSLQSVDVLLGRSHDHRYNLKLFFKEKYKRTCFLHDQVCWFPRQDTAVSSDVMIRSCNVAGYINTSHSKTGYWFSILSTILSTCILSLIELEASIEDV